MIVGIDPPKGLAYVRDNELHLMSVDFLDILDFLQLNVHEIDKVFIEATHKINNTFGRKIIGKSLRERDRISRNVGMNQHAAKQIVEKCRRLGLDYQEIIPTAKSMTKIHPDVFSKYWNCKIYGKNNEHTRDAAMLICGR